MVARIAVQKLTRLEDKLIPANLRSEIEGLALVFGVGGGTLLLHRHQAYWIYRHSTNYLSSQLDIQRNYGREGESLSMIFRTSSGPSLADLMGPPLQPLFGMRSALR